MNEYINSFFNKIFLSFVPGTRMKKDGNSRGREGRENPKIKAEIRKRRAEFLGCLLLA